MKRDMFRRFNFIETALYWGVGITAGKLGKTFEIARQNAQASIADYRKKHPQNIRYNASGKYHEATEDFAPQYIRSEPWPYLNYLRGNSLTNHYWADEEWSDLSVVDVDLHFQPQLNIDVIRKLTSAIQTERALILDYHAKAETHRITVAPNQLVYASRRYHIRAYCYEWNKFIDIVPSRIINIEFSGEDWVSSEEDAQWHKRIELKFTPNSKLPAQVISTLRMDYSLTENTYRIRTREALKGYILRDMERPDWKYGIPLWLEIPC